MPEHKTVAYYPGYELQMAIINIVLAINSKIAEINSDKKRNERPRLTYKEGELCGLINKLYNHLIWKVGRYETKNERMLGVKKRLLGYMDYFVFGTQSPYSLSLIQLLNVYNDLMIFAEEYQILRIEHKLEPEDEVDFLAEGSI